MQTTETYWVEVDAIKGKVTVFDDESYTYIALDGILSVLFK